MSPPRGKVGNFCPLCLAEVAKEASVENSECAKLTALYKEKAAAGLLDVKFYLRNLEDAGTEEVCREVNQLYAAVENGDLEPLDFGDLRWREMA